MRIRRRARIGAAWQRRCKDRPGLGAELDCSVEDQAGRHLRARRLSMSCCNSPMLDASISGVLHLLLFAERRTVMQLVPRACTEYNEQRTEPGNLPATGGSDEKLGLFLLLRGACVCVRVQRVAWEPGKREEPVQVAPLARTRHTCRGQSVKTVLSREHGPNTRRHTAMRALSHPCLRQPTRQQHDSANFACLLPVVVRTCSVAHIPARVVPCLISALRGSSPCLTSLRGCSVQCTLCQPLF